MEKEFYKNSPNVILLEEDTIPETLQVSHTNNCQIGIYPSAIENQLIIISAIGLFYFIMSQDSDLWFFNVLIYSETDFYTLGEIIRDNYIFIIKTIIFVLFLVACNVEKLGFNNLQDKIKNTFFGYKNFFLNLKFERVASVYFDFPFSLLEKYFLTS